MAQNTLYHDDNLDVLTLDDHQVDEDHLTLVGDETTKNVCGDYKLSKRRRTS